MEVIITFFSQMFYPLTDLFLSESVNLLPNCLPN
jgi:hypothetical protein